MGKGETRRQKKLQKAVTREAAPASKNDNCALTLKYEVFGRFSVIAVIKDAKTKRAVKAPINLKF